MNIILDEPTAATPFFTDMKATLEATAIRITDFDWYISDLETNCALEQAFGSSGWMTGIELQEALNKQDIQFIWAVFSAFSKGTRVEIANEPYADGNTSYWTNQNLKPQLAESLFEIVAWDSSATLLIGVDDAAGLVFMKKFPRAKLLVPTAGSNAI